MKKLTLAFLIIWVSINAYSQTKITPSNLNLGFEFIEKGMPANWTYFGSANYVLALDSIHTKSGKYAASIAFTEGSTDYKAWEFALPHNYDGKNITLTGYVKTENVSDGFAGLWMRIDPNIAFYNMYQNGIKGTTDWHKYEVTLKMNPKRTKKIVLGGLLVGKGKMWLDDLKVTIDGKDIENIQPYERKLLPAEKDQEFDKGSGITMASANKTQMENLKQLGLIWGFLKYHHPNIAKGNYNWDYELFRIMPSITNASNNKNRDSILTKWIAGLGEFKEGKEILMKPSEVKIEPDLGWIKNAHFSDELTALLLKVKNAKRMNKHYYIGLNAWVGNPDFKNENSYSSMKYPDAGFRVLALYRYWNIIQYFFPYKNLIEEDWKNVLEEFIPKIIEAKNETEYTLVMLELIGRINDTHANIWGSNPALKSYLGMRYAPVELTFVENKAVVTGFYDGNKKEETGLEIGDVVTSINNKPVEEIVKENLKFYPASNYPTKLRNISSNLLRTDNTAIYIEYFRDNKKENKIIKTYYDSEFNKYARYQKKDTCFKLINKDIAYLNNGSVKRNYLPIVWKEIENTKGLIIDIRNYPSDFVLYHLSKYLMPRGTKFVKFTNGNIKSPGLFTYTKSLYAGIKNKKYYKGKVVILVNETTQSSAEFHSMAYRVHPNAIVIGSTTAGADGNVSDLYLPGGINTMISGIGVYYPDGKETQRIGIVPNIELKPTIQGIKEGKDELMEKAIEIINGK